MKPKRTRVGARGARKVKTGCLTCRIRHKKCDEARPACSQCLHADQSCDFLTSCTTQLHRPRLCRLEPKPRMVGQPCSILPLGNLEMLHFEYFRDVCTKEFSLYFDVSLWGRLVLQAAHAEPCIRHAVLAIGALGRHSTTLYVSQESAFEYSMKQYNLAIQALNLRLDTSSRSWTLAVLASLVFIAIDVLQGRDDIVRMHLQSVFAILRSGTNKVRSCSFVEDAGPTTFQFTSDLHLLFHAFARLDIRTPSILIAHQVMPLPTPRLPIIITSIDEARRTLNSVTSVVNSILHNLNLNNQTMLHSPLHSFVRNGLATVEELFAAWQSAFEKFTRHHSTTDIKAKASIHILRIHSLVARIQASAYFCNDELAYDSHFDLFKKIVHLATAVLEADQLHPSSIRSGPCNILDIGMVQPLFFVARKCRDGILRRKAIEAMEKVRKERVHDVQLLAAVARWIAAIEEGEQKRLYEVDLDFVAIEGSCVATAKRRIHDCWEEVSATIT